MSRLAVLEIWSAQKSAMDGSLIDDDLRERAADQVAAAAFAPRAAQSDLLVLAGLVGELNHIVMTVSDPMAGELRLQWWRDAVLTSQAGQSSGNEVADRAAALIEKLSWPEARFNQYVDAHADSMYADRPIDDAAFQALLDARFAEPMRMAGHIIDPSWGGPGDPAAVDDVFARAGRAYGLMRTAVSREHVMRLGRNPLPPSFDPVDTTGVAAPAQPQTDGDARLIEEARTAVRQLAPAFAGLPRAARSALLPVAVVEPHLKALQRQSDRTASLEADAVPWPPVEIAPLVRFGRMFWSHTTGRL